MPERTRVKICGITNLSDAEAAVEVGADAIGLVFYGRSPRCVDIDVAAEITYKVAPFVNCVGLFVDAAENRIRRVLEQVAIDTLQFHGQETEQFCNLYNVPYIKAIKMVNTVDLFEQCDRFSLAKALLLDADAGTAPGGTGTTFDWERIPKGLKKPFILAGGLNADNVRKAVSLVQPYAVDVSSGVETEKGRKDLKKMRQFIHAVYGANT